MERGSARRPIPNSQRPSGTVTVGQAIRLPVGAST
jgi:hypothetical protein